MILNALLIAIREIRRNLTRSFLTVVGIVIGVAAVVTMVTLGRGATVAVQQQISKMGSNILVLRPGQSWGVRGVPQFSLEDVHAIEQQVLGVACVAPLVQTSGTAIYQENDRSSKIQGTTDRYFQMTNWELSMGRFFTANEVEQAAPICVIGETIRKELIGLSEDPIGAQIRINGMSLEVVGVTAVKGQGGFGEDLDDTIFTPYTTVLTRMMGRGNGQNIQFVMISGQPSYPTSHIIADVTLLIRERRYLTESEENNFSLFDSTQLADVMSSTTKVMTSLLGAVAGVSLLVGGIGIMNIMLVSVTERTREIGIRLAIGARAREVLLQFLVEAVTLSCVGGMIGILLAYVLCVLLADIVGSKFIFDVNINVIAFAFSAFIGILFGYMPARRAASLDPIEALRHE